MKREIKISPSSNNSKPIKPKFKQLHGGFLTDKIVMTVRRDKAKKNKDE